MKSIQVRARGGRSFNLRLVAMIGLTLAVVATAQYVVGSRVFRERVFDQALTGYQGDAEVLESLWASRQHPWSSVTELLGHIAHRPGVQAVAIVGADGVVEVVGGADHGSAEPGESHDGHVAADHGEGGHAEKAHTAPPSHDDVPHAHVFVAGEPLNDQDAALVDGALGTGEPFAGEEPDAEHGAAAYVIPVEFDGRYALFVVTEMTSVHTQLADLRTLLFMGFVLALALGTPTAYLLGGRRLSQLHRHHLERALQDPLTGLANHRAYQDDVREQLEIARRHDRPLTLALLDLDGFKLVNDTAGHRKGDEVLLKVAGILADGRSGDRAFRVGGDEFALLMPSTDVEAARTACERVRDQVAAWVPEVGVSIGLAEFHRHAEDVEALWECADAAMYRAKVRGPNHVVAFAELDDGHPGVTLTKATALRALLDESAIDVVFQPVVSLVDRSVIGYEALARPPAVTGFSGPAEAFAVARRLGKAAELDALCRRAAISSAADLPAGTRLFLNIAVESLSNDLLDWSELLSRVTEAGLRPDDVTIELTGNGAPRPATLLDEVRQARQAGFQIGLDDLGAGETSFPALAALRPDTIKIDASVIRRAPQDAEARGVLVAIVAYGTVTGAELVAEGIEDDEMLATLTAIDGAERIGAAQGFLFGRPAPARSLHRQHHG